MSIEEERAAQRISDRLHTLRGWMHWLMNTAADTWRYADKRASTKNPDKEVRDRGEVTQAVKDACDRQRAYAAESLSKVQTGIEKLRVKLGSAKARNRTKDVERLERELANELRRADRFRDAADLVLPGNMRDVIVNRAEDAFKRWAKNKGEMAYPSFRYGQPIHYRDGDWSIDVGAKRGIYTFTVPVGGERSAIERVALTVVPEDGSAHAFAKMMVDGRAKLCNAILTWSEKKRCWFAKLTIRYPRELPAKVRDGGSCAIRLGVHNAIVLAFDNGEAEVIRGTDLVRYKERLRARYCEIQKHLRSPEAGSGARGRGVKRRFKALVKLAEREENHVNTTIGRWSQDVVARMKRHGVSTLYLALESSSMLDAFGRSDDGRGHEVVRAYLAKFPRFKLRDAIMRAVEESGRMVKVMQTKLDAKTCPNCEHRHDARPSGSMFHCEVCGAAAPADYVTAWNLINEATGSKVPFRERLRKRAALLKSIGHGEGMEDGSESA